MTGKQYLKQAYRLNELINSDIEEIEQLKVLSRSVTTSNFSGNISSGTKNTDPYYVRTLEKINELEEVINAEIDSLIALKKEIRTVINQIHDNSERLVLILRYIHFYKWEAVAADMELSLKQVHRLHNNALKNIKIPFSETK